MSAPADETAAPQEPDLRVDVDGFMLHHHTHSHFLWGPPLFYGPQTPYFATAPFPSGAGGGGGDGYGPRAPVVYGTGSGRPPYRRGFHVPDWFSDAFFALLALFIVIVLAVLAHWAWNHFDGNDQKSAPASVVPRHVVRKTMPQILASERFAVNYHALCKYVTVADGMSYKLYLNRGNACLHTVQTIVPADKVDGLEGKHVRRLNVTFVFDKKTYGPARVRTIKNLSLGRQLETNLRNIVARERK